MNYSKFLYVVAFATVLFTACGNDSSTSANNSNDGDNSSKSSSSQKTVSSSSREVIEFVNPADVIVGSMTDSRDGKKYKTVKIGKQTWMAQNLNYKMANSYCYNDTSSYCDKYGRLYAWAAAVGKSEDVCGYDHSCSLPSGYIQGVCPSSWHLPTKTEWETLITAVGGQSTAAKILKSTSGWNNDGNGTDAFSFSALPAGYRDYNWYYDYKGLSANFWSSTEYGSGNAYFMYLGYYDDNAGLYDVNKGNGFSVRCLKD